MSVLYDAYDRLLKAFGHQHWWPGDSAFEIAVGAILTQNTNWKNVEKALENLRESDALSVSAIDNLAQEELEELIRPAGYFRLKTKRLKNFVSLIMNEFDGDFDLFLGLDKESLREKLLGVNGIGPETADSIVLYAAEKPIFVIDAYTSRVLKRHGWIDYDADYFAMQEYFHSSLETNVELFNEYHALIVQVGKQFCGKKPKCDECPLCEMLPDSGIVEPF
ncbi:MAG: endonuclease III domain-containing protein [Planctomycetota bacterium]